jgi:hypothetical protein
MTTKTTLTFATLDDLLAYQGPIADATGAISKFITRQGATIEEARKVTAFVMFRREVEGWSAKQIRGEC